MRDIDWDGSDRNPTVWGRGSIFETGDMMTGSHHGTRVRTEEIIRFARTRSRRYSYALAWTVTTCLDVVGIVAAIYGSHLWINCLIATVFVWVMRPLFAAMFRGHDFDKVARSYDQHRTCLNDKRSAEALHSIEELAVPTDADGQPVPPDDDSNRLRLMRYAAALPADVLATALKAAPELLSAAQRAADTAKVTAYEAHIAAHATTEPRAWLRREAELRAELPEGYQS